MWASKKLSGTSQKGQSSFEVQTNNGYKPWKYSKRARRKPPFLTAAILEFFVRPQVPASRDEKAANQPRTGVSFLRACLALRARESTSAFRLPLLAWKARKSNLCFSGYWSRVLRFLTKILFQGVEKKYLNLWSSSRQNLRRADRERLIFPLLMQQSQSRRLLHADHYYDCCLFVCFIQFRNECSRLQVNGGYQNSWGYYVWQVFGENNLGPSLELFL